MNIARLAGGGMPLVLLCLLSTCTSSALASTSARPTIRSVTPMTAKIGDRLTIKGRNLATARGRATVVFKVAGKTVAVKVKRATRTKIRLVIPATLAQYLPVDAGLVHPTKVRLRVRGVSTGKRFTTLARSPTIGLLGGLPGAVPAWLDALLFPVPPGLDPSDDCNGDGVLNDLDDVVIESVDGPHSICAADNNS